MADDKNKGTAAVAGKTEAKFDPSKYLAPGMNKEKIRKVGNLTPIWSGEIALEKGLVLAGRMDRLEILDMGEDKDPKDRYRPMIRVVCAFATTGVLGAKKEQKKVEVPAGEDILLPITGSLKANKAVLLSAWDPKTVNYIIARAIGHVDTGKPSEMVEIETHLVDDPIVREGRFAQPPQYVYSPRLGKHGTVVAVDQAPAGLLPNGESYDMDGVVHEKQIAQQTS